jgi:hypothetical protein
MHFRFGDSEVLALVACTITVWLFAVRGKLPIESNWPLIYYLGMVLYQKTGGKFLDPRFIYVGVVCAMLIRFEFLATGFIKFFRVLESITLIYLTWKCLDFVFFR